VCAADGLSELCMPFMVYVAIHRTPVETLVHVYVLRTCTVPWYRTYLTYVRKKVLQYGTVPQYLVY
jgi:hypothetical protein